MKRNQNVLLAWTAFLNITGAMMWLGVESLRGDEYRTPDDDRLATLRMKFKEVKHPVTFRVNVLQHSMSVKYDDSVARVELTGDARWFAENASTAELIFALWGFLDDPVHDADAGLILLSKLNCNVSEEYGISYDKPSERTYWPRQRARVINLCRTDSRSILHEGPDWYPHKVLFDRETVLAESTSNALARASYIAAMQKALADPKIRTENPLEIKNILGLLCEMGASETATNFCDYLFYDWKTATDHRIQEHDKSDQGIYPASSLAAIACLARLGEKCMSQVLDRFANATPEESSMQVGGGGLPILAIRYFYLQFMKETDAIKKLEDYKQAHANLTKQQVAALDIILDAIKTKKVRPFFMDHSDWAAPKGVVTNAPSVK